MTKTRSTKSALISSVIALLLCFAMLVGSTFAWFTDSVTSANNIIKSGNLDIELDYWDGDSWETVQGTDALFTDNLWEPGHTEVVYLKLSNLGSLALKYQLAISVLSETEGTNMAGAPFKLSDYIQMGVVEGVNGETGAYANRATAVDAVKDASGIIGAGYTKSGEMLADADELYMAVVVYMPETVGNVANAKTGTPAPTINLGVQVLATQLAAEDDGFDNQYDAGSPWLSAADIDWYVNDPDATEFEINTPEQLAGLAAIVNGTATANVSTYASTSEATTIKDDFAGQTIKLTGDVDLNNVNWTPIGNESNPFNGVFDGGNFTISNLAIKDLNGDCVALFGFIGKTTVKNIKIHNVNIHGLMRVAAAVGATKPSAVIDNVHVSGDIKLVADEYYAAGIVTHGYVTVKNCSVVADDMGLIDGNGGMVGGICGWRGEGKSSIENCHVKNMNMIGRASIGGLAALIHYNNTVSGCSVENVTLTKTRVDGWGSIGALCGNWGGVDKAGTAVYTVTDNTIENVTLNGTAIKLFSEIYGSKYSSPEADMPLVESGNTFENITNNLVEVTLVTPGVVENNGVKQIFTAEGLNSLGGTKVNGTYELVADIDMTGYEMKSMEVSGGATVNFIGNGHTISNLTLNAAGVHGMTGAGNEVAGLFDLSAPATTVSLTVSDLAFANTTVACSGYAGVVVGYNPNGGTTITLNNIDVAGATVTSDTVAALVGYTTGVVNLTDCDVSTLALTGEAGRPDKVGAYVGSANTATCAVTMSNCTNGTTYNHAGRVINGATMTVDGVAYVTNADGLAAAVANGATNILLAEGEYDVPNFGEGKVNGVTFTGASREGVVIKLYNTSSGGDFCLANSTATLENMTIVTEIKDWAGFQNAQNLTFNQCNFVNNLFLSGNATFNECHFTVTTNHYNVWAYSANSRNYTAEFNDCVFDCAGKSIYIDGNAGGTTTMKFTGCTFNDNDGGATDKAAIETGTTYGAGATYNVIITECEFNGFAVNPNGANTDSTIWANKNSMTADKLNITIDGTKVY